MPTKVYTRKRNSPKTRSSVKAAQPQPHKSKQKNPKVEKTDSHHKASFTTVSRKTAQEMMTLLCKQYPDAQCELNFKNDFQLLAAVILSAQCTDTQVNKVTRLLFKRFPSPRALADANLNEVKEIIRSTGYYNAKAANIQACAQAIAQRFGGKVPQSLEELTSLSGVGRKSANVVLGVAHNIRGWTVDTHVKRLTRRLGFSDRTDPFKIEQDLMLLFPEPEEDWSKLSITLIWHGRRTCFARKPDCAHCPVNHLCPSSLI